MRDLLKTIMTSSMVAGAALLVSACGGDVEETENLAVDNMAMDPMMDGTTNDVTAVDGAMGTDANMMDTNMTMDANMTGNMDMGTNMTAGNTMGADANMTNGM